METKPPVIATAICWLLGDQAIAWMFSSWIRRLELLGRMGLVLIRVGFNCRGVVVATVIGIGEGVVLGLRVLVGEGGMVTAEIRVGVGEGKMVVGR